SCFIDEFGIEILSLSKLSTQKVSSILSTLVDVGRDERRKSSNQRTHHRRKRTYPSTVHMIIGAIEPAAGRSRPGKKPSPAEDAREASRRAPPPVTGLAKLDEAGQRGRGRTACMGQWAAAWSARRDRARRQVC